MVIALAKRRRPPWVDSSPKEAPYQLARGQSGLEEIPSDLFSDLLHSFFGVAYFGL